MLELTRLNLELQELKNRNLQLSGRVETLARRAKTLEDMAARSAAALPRRGSASAAERVQRRARRTIAR